MLDSALSIVPHLFKNTFAAACPRRFRYRRIQSTHINIIFSTLQPGQIFLKPASLGKARVYMLAIETRLIRFIPSDSAPSSVVPHFVNNTFAAAYPRRFNWIRMMTNTFVNIIFSPPHIWDSCKILKWKQSSVQESSRLQPNRVSFDVHIRASMYHGKQDWYRTGL